jgi:hypothetical protein
MLQEWWNDIVQWITSRQGRELITSSILPFIAIMASGIIAALIARGAVKRLVTQRDREHKTAAIATLLAAARRAAAWSTLTATEKDHVDFQLSEAEVRVRLLPVAGSGLAADWAAHYLASMKKNSASYAFQAEQDLADLQDGLIAWQDKPGKARKLFAADLTTWKYEAPAAEDELLVKQREWAASQASADSSPVIPRPATD